MNLSQFFSPSVASMPADVCPPAEHYAFSMASDGWLYLHEKVQLDLKNKWFGLSTAPSPFTHNNLLEIDKVLTGEIVNACVRAELFWLIRKYAFEQWHKAWNAEDRLREPAYSALLDELMEPTAIRFQL